MKCDSEYKLFLLQCAIARDFELLNSSNKSWENFHRLNFNTLLQEFKEALTVYQETAEIIRKGIIDKGALRRSLQLLITSLNIQFKHDTCFSSLRTFLIEFALDDSYLIRASMCRSIVLEDPKNIRATYLYSFYSQAGKTISYSWQTRYSLYSLILSQWDDLSDPICISPLAGISIGHYYLLLQAICCAALGKQIWLFSSTHQIGKELLPSLGIGHANIIEYNENLDIEVLCKGYNSDLVASSYALKNICRRLSYVDNTELTVCLHLRTEGFKQQGGSCNTLRNSSPANYERLGELLLNLLPGVNLIRVCCVDDHTLNHSLWNFHIVHNHDSACKQWNIIRSSRFFIGCNSGISNLAPYLAKSVLIVNATSLWSSAALDENIIFALKTIEARKDNSLLLSREDFMALVFMDWVETDGLSSYYTVLELTSDQLCDAYEQSSSGKIVLFSTLCEELNVAIPPRLPARFITQDCASNIAQHVHALQPASSSMQSPAITSIIW